MTIEYQFYGSLDENKKYLLNLVINNKEKASSEDDDYIELEFRHNKMKDTATEVNEGYVSFKLDTISDQISSKKGLKIRVNSINDGVKVEKVEFEN